MSRVKSRQKFTYDYPRPAVTVDVVVLTRESRPRVLLIRRKNPPFAGGWAIPGGFIEMDETLEASARRELGEETGLEVGPLQQLRTFGDPGRDPRGRTVSIVFWTQIEAPSVDLAARDDAAELGWYYLDHLPPLAFDHADILSLASHQIPPKKKRQSPRAAKKNPGK
jgi:8-oxo-dGTP diphosphatase